MKKLTPAKTGQLQKFQAQEFLPNFREVYAELKDPRTPTGGKRNSMKKNASPDLYLVCEGQTDRRLLAALIQRILRTKHSSATVSLTLAGGKLAVPGNIRALESRVPPGAPLGMVVNSDGDVAGTESFLRRNLDLQDYFAMIAHPSLESWFDLTEDEVYKMLRNPQEIQAVVDNADLTKIAREHPELNQLIDIVTSLKRKPKRVSSAAFAPPRDLRAKVRSER